MTEMSSKTSYVVNALNLQYIIWESYRKPNCNIVINNDVITYTTVYDTTFWRQIYWSQI